MPPPGVPVEPPAADEEEEDAGVLICEASRVLVEAVGRTAIGVEVLDEAVESVGVAGAGGTGADVCPCPGVEVTVGAAV